VPDIWEDIAKWAVGIIATISALFFEGVRRWNSSRFHGVNKRIDDHKKIIDSHGHKLAEHDVSITRFDANLEAIRENTREAKDEMKEINRKLDRVISGR